MRLDKYYLNFSLRSKPATFMNKHIYKFLDLPSKMVRLINFNEFERSRNFRLLFFVPSSM